MAYNKDSSESQQAPTSPKAKDLGHVKLLYCGFISGLVQAGIFNPWDRALYLSVSNDRPFLHKLNFVSPMNGVFQTIFQRGISAGLYFPLEEIFTLYLKETFIQNKNNNSGTGSSSSSSGINSSSSVPGSSSGATSETWLLLCAGLMAGAGNGIIMNPISSIKYHYWGLSGGGVGFKGGEGSGLQPDGKKNTFSTVALDMFKRGGLRPFFVGVNATISRDVIFGGAFSYMRHELPKLHFFTCPASVSSFSLAGIVSVFSNSTLGSTLSTVSAAASSSSQEAQLLSPMETNNNSNITSNITSKNSNNNNKSSSNSSSGGGVLSYSGEPKSTFLTDLISGLIATTLSSPLNYVRNIHYSLPPDIKPDSTTRVLSDLWAKAMEERSLISKMSHLQSRLRLGWGTARVGCGMALASQFYSYIKSYI